MQKLLLPLLVASAVSAERHRLRAPHGSDGSDAAPTAAHQQTWQQAAPAAVGGSKQTTVSCPDRGDCTKALQSVLSDTSVGEVVVPAGGGPWAVGPLFIYRSHLALTLQPGVVLYAKQGDFKNTGDNLLRIKSDMGHGHVKNITIIATGATLRMRKMEYLPPKYVKAEWRHTLGIFGASDVTVIGGTYLESGGDGIYVDGGGLTNYSENVLLQSVTTDAAWRNGLSVISAVNLTVVDAVFKNTNGARLPI